MITAVIVLAILYIIGAFLFGAISLYGISQEPPESKKQFTGIHVGKIASIIFWSSAIWPWSLLEVIILHILNGKK